MKGKIVPFSCFALRAPAVLGVSVSMLVGLATPAAASTVGAGSCGYASAGQFCVGVAQAQPVGSASQTVAFSCSVVSTVPVQVTAAHCYLQGVVSKARYYAPPIWVNGQAATTGNVAVQIPVEPYEVCVGSGIVDILGISFPLAGYVCMPWIV